MFRSASAHNDDAWNPPRRPPGGKLTAWMVGRWSYLPVAFVLVSLVALLLAPLPTRTRTDRLWYETVQLIEPARRLIDDIQFALALEVSAIRGYVLTRDQSFLERHQLAVEYERRAASAFRELAEQLGPQVSQRAQELDTAQLQWRMPVARLLDQRMTPEEYVQRVPLQQALYEDILATAASLESIIVQLEEQNLTKIRGTEHLDLLLRVGLGFLALAAALVVAGLNSRLRFSAIELDRYAREEARLLESEHEARKVAEEAVRTRDDVLGVVSHDLRNPLNSIAVSTALLDEPSIPAEMRSRQVEVVRRAVDGMNRLIQDLLDVAKIETGLLMLELDSIDVGSVMGEARELLRSQAGDKRVELELASLAQDLPAVRADRDRLLQALTNVLGNAVRSTPEDGSVLLGAERSGGAVHLSIEDSAPVLSDEELPHLFDPYYWRSREPGHRGAYMGLRIAKGIVEMHGGRIWVEPMPGRGNRFVLALPAAS
jgi:signal transduction histidine kinase